MARIEFHLFPDASRDRRSSEAHTRPTAMFHCRLIGIIILAYALSALSPPPASAFQRLLAMSMPVCVVGNGICLLGDIEGGGTHHRRTRVYVAGFSSELHEDSGSIETIRSELEGVIGDSNCLSLLKFERQDESLRLSLSQKNYSNVSEIPTRDLIALRFKGVEFLVFGRLTASPDNESKKELSIVFQPIEGSEIIREHSSIEASASLSRPILEHAIASVCENDLSRSSDQRPQIASSFRASRFVSRSATACYLVGGLSTRHIEPNSMNIGRPSAASRHRIGLQRNSSRWIFYGNWNEEDGELALIDSVSGEDLSILLEEPGKSDTIATSNIMTIMDDTPVKAHLPVGELRAIFIDPATGQREKVTGSFVDWRQSGSVGFAYGNFQRSNGEWSIGFFEFQQEEDILVKPVFELSQAERLFSPYYYLGNSYIATDNSHAYFLVLGTIPVLYKVALGSSSFLRPVRMNSVPREGYSIPVRAHPVDPGRAVDFMNSVANNTMPTALLLHDGFIFLMTRVPAASGNGTVWTLHKIDPRKDEIVKVVELPTRAMNLLPFPGNQYWAFIEKGSVYDIGAQEVQSAFLATPFGDSEFIHRVLLDSYPMESYSALASRPQPRGGRGDHRNGDINDLLENSK